MFHGVIEKTGTVFFLRHGASLLSFSLFRPTLYTHITLFTMKYDCIEVTTTRQKTRKYFFKACSSKLLCCYLHYIYSKSAYIFCRYGANFL